jgi:signal transduction histidine kinase
VHYPIRTGRFRWRLTVAFILLAVASAGVLALTAFVLVREERERLFEERVRREARLSVSLAEEALSSPAEVTDIRRLLSRFERRGDFKTVVVFEGKVFRSHSHVGLEQVPSRLRAPRDREQLVTASTEIRRPHLVVRSSLQAPPVDMYFFFSQESLYGGLGRLLRVLLRVWVGVVVLAAGAGTILARRTLQPVARASAAARSLAEGLLDTRLPVDRQDEFGAWAVSFNEMAQALQERLDALKEAHEREKRFTSDVSHELRTPLTALVSAASLVRENLEDMSPRTRWAAERMVAEVPRLRRLVEELIEISRLDAGREALRSEPLDLFSVVARLTASRGWASAVRLEGRRTPVHTDRRRVERIVGNLIDNAVAHGRREVRVSVGQENGWATVEVQDDGPGIPTEHLGHIFDRFYKIDPARSGGSGLGLSIAAENAKLLGGTIDAESEPGSGACFTFSFPATTLLPDGEDAVA